MQLSISAVNNNEINDNNQSEDLNNEEDNRKNKNKVENIISNDTSLIGKSKLSVSFSKDDTTIEDIKKDSFSENQMVLDATVKKYSSVLFLFIA